MDSQNGYGKVVAYYGPFTEEESNSIREVLDSDLRGSLKAHEPEESLVARRKQVAQLLAARKATP